MTDRHFTRRQPARRKGFSWARIPDGGSGVTYRLYRYDLHGILHAESHRFSHDPRMVIAIEINRARHRLRDMVDAIDLEILGVTAS